MFLSLSLFVCLSDALYHLRPHRLRTRVLRLPARDGNRARPCAMPTRRRGGRLHQRQARGPWFKPTRTSHSRDTPFQGPGLNPTLHPRNTNLETRDTPFPEPATPHSRDTPFPKHKLETHPATHPHTHTHTHTQTHTHTHTHKQARPSSPRATSRTARCRSAGLRVEG